ncbi:hypothetical protein [Nocardia noduli]|nr:hypothetical protein [Nocardia noduli]
MQYLLDGVGLQDGEVAALFTVEVVDGVRDGQTLIAATAGGMTPRHARL